MTEIDCQHKWEYYIADKRIPYYFCCLCKHTLYNGNIYGFKK